MTTKAMEQKAKENVLRFFEECEKLEKEATAVNWYFCPTVSYNVYRQDWRCEVTVYTNTSPMEIVFSTHDIYLDEYETSVRMAKLREIIKSKSVKPMLERQLKEAQREVEAVNSEIAKLDRNASKV